jgi:hypothetical protein
MANSNDRDAFKDAAGVLQLAPRILEMQRRAGRGGGQEALALLDCPVAQRRGGYSPRDLARIVNFVVRVGGGFGLLNTCLSRSAIQCRLMRENGIDARVLFGLNREGDELSGHCWTVWEGGPGPGLRNSNFKTVEIRPSPEKFPGWTPL